MKSVLLVLVLFFAAQSSFAADVLNNCFKGRHAQFFASDLASISRDGETPVLLLNEAKQVVGVVSVTPESKSVTVNKLSLCSSLETSDFYYTTDDSEDLLKWLTASAGSLEISQDEGLITLQASTAKAEKYATMVKVEFKAYDVFNMDEEPKEEDTKSPDYVKDWGLPKGKGTFYFYLPTEWLKAKK